jgi:hypothetical protein
MTAGDVAVINKGRIVTNGASAFGLVAMSLGAGGLAGLDGNGSTSGVVGSNLVNPGGGAAGVVTVDNYGAVRTGDGQGDGKVAIGIIAGDRRARDSDLLVRREPRRNRRRRRQCGDGDGRPCWPDHHRRQRRARPAGAKHWRRRHSRQRQHAAGQSGGSGTTMDGAAGLAVTAGYGLTNVSNAGTITGSIDLGATPGVISNVGLLNTGPILVVATLSNAAASGWSICPRPEPRPAPRPCCKAAQACSWPGRVRGSRMTLPWERSTCVPMATWMSSPRLRRDSPNRVRQGSRWRSAGTTRRR